GRDVDQIARDLVEVAMGIVRENKREAVKAKAHSAAENRVLDALVGPGAGLSTRESFRKKLLNGELDDKEIEIQVADDSSPLGGMDIPGMPGGVGMINLSDLLGKGFGGKTKTLRTSVKDAYEPLIAEEADKLLDENQIQTDAVKLAQDEGIVFLDEIDKVCARADARGADVSREGVQRDLLPLIEGAVVATKYGPVKTDHVLFIASGAFHLNKPSDLLPELQGRLPIRVELKALTRDDFRAILTEPEASLVTQYEALMKTEGFDLKFDDSAIDAVADFAAEVNASVENIGARRLQTIMERVVEEVSYTASDREGESLVVDADYVKDRVDQLAKNTDLSKFIL
ncbi:MAG: ATP-dependent protease ATPase subunit HslU, partial [Oceanicaulis sp.]